MKLRPLAAILGALACTASFRVMAGPADYVYVPAVEYGEHEIDFKYGKAKEYGEGKESAASIGFGLGATERWFTEIYLKYEKEAGEGTKLEAVEWENKFQLTETGKYPVDIGLITEIEIPREHGEAYEFKVGPLFQTEFGKVQLNGNLLFERKFRGSDDEKHETEIGYQWQVKYRLQPSFEFGLQGFGEMGKWNDWAPSSEQTHRAGPAVFGKIGLGGKHALKYNAALLYGISDGAADRTFRMQAEYEF